MIPKNIVQTDYELVKEILLAVENCPYYPMDLCVKRQTPTAGDLPDTFQEFSQMLKNGYNEASRQTIFFHLLMLVKGGMLDGSIHTAAGQEKGPAKMVHVYCLTWEGQNFLNNTKVPEAWTRFKRDVDKRGYDLSWSIVTSVLQKLAERVVFDSFGV